MIPLARIALTYVGIAVALSAALRVPTHAQRAALRAAWSTGWFVVSGNVLAHFIMRGEVHVDMAEAFAPAAWVVAIACAKHNAERATWGWLGVLVVALDVWFRSGWPASGAAVLGCVFGAAVAHAMASRTHLVFRIVAHWLSFAGSFGLLLPAAIVSATGPSGAPWAGVALALAAVGTAIAFFATRLFFRTGGTPEPLDPPTRLVTSGIYSYVRHPIQIAEILFVFAGLALMPQLWVAIYALGFKFALTVPFRRKEERSLEGRFGDDYRAWRNRVGAYWPKRSFG